MAITRTFPSFAANCPPCAPAPKACVSCTTHMPVQFTSIDELVHEPQFSAQDAPVAYIQHNLVNAAVKVARDMKVLTRKVTLDIQKGVRDYYVCPEDGERWHWINSACICGRCIEFAEPPCCDTGCECSLGQTASFEGPDKVLLNWSPEKDIPGGITLEMVAVPARGACRFDSWFVEVFGEAIQTKALATMRRDKGGKEPNSWYDPALARELDRYFENDLMARHKIDKATKYNAHQYRGPG